MASPVSATYASRTLSLAKLLLAKKAVTASSLILDPECRDS
jgi:hypothetical protein